MVKNKNIKIKLLPLMIPVFLFFNRCTTLVKDYIPGTYVTEWTTEFTEARDTMLIEPSVKDGSGTYQITRRIYMLYQKRPQYKLVHWTGTFNSGNKTIIINNNGRILSFDPANKEMKMGSTIYKKL
jgi:hypothetical protein